jgi:hypothetical protein
LMAAVGDTFLAFDFSRALILCFTRPWVAFAAVGEKDGDLDFLDFELLMPVTSGVFDSAVFSLGSEKNDTLFLLPIASRVKVSSETTSEPTVNIEAVAVDSVGPKDVSLVTLVVLSTDILVADDDDDLSSSVFCDFFVLDERLWGGSACWVEDTPAEAFALEIGWSTAETSAIGEDIGVVDAFNFFVVFVLEKEEAEDGFEELDNAALGDFTCVESSGVVCLRDGLLIDDE